MHKLSHKDTNDFLRSISKGCVVYACKADDKVGDGKADKDYRLVRADEWNANVHTLAPYRAVEPLKSLVFKLREYLGTISEHAEPQAQDAIVIGVKNCDLSALKIHDYVFLNTEPEDPFYAAARRKTIIVSCDCTDARQVCFCPAVNQTPYAKEGFDINLSPVSDGYVVEAGSEKGKKILKDAEHYLQEADSKAVQERDRKRAEMTERVSQIAASKGVSSGSNFRDAVRKSSESKLWDEFAKDCVECGACNFVCCTCHCFVLTDGISRAGKPARVKQWDSCLYGNFARVAGGANPRKHRAERLHNRFDKKFNFFPEVLGVYACDGCGRCIEACAGKIDIREVLKKAVNEL